MSPLLFWIVLAYSAISDWRFFRVALWVPFALFFLGGGREISGVWMMLLFGLMRWGGKRLLHKEILGWGDIFVAVALGAQVSSHRMALFLMLTGSLGLCLHFLPRFQSLGRIPLVTVMAAAYAVWSFLVVF